MTSREVFAKSIPRSSRHVLTIPAKRCIIKGTQLQRKGYYYPKAPITEKGEKALRGGHPWVYADEVTEVSGEYENGGLADVFSRKGRYLGTGYINDNSKIRIRVIARNANDRFDRDFYARRIRYALDYRRTVMGAEDFRCCRLIFGEADSFPGFTVDRFGDVLVAQVLSLGTERVKDALYELLVQTLADMGEHISAIYERNDVKIRELEGMEEYKGFWAGAGLRTDLSGVTEITENGIKYTVDYINGQKSGFFLDQKYNRQAIRRIAEGRTVLDCFTHTGSLALNAAAAGAKSVTAVDISADAIEMTRRNAEQNGFTNVEFRQAARQTAEALDSYELPELRYFREHFLGSFQLTLDEME